MTSNIYKSVLLLALISVLAYSAYAMPTIGNSNHQNKNVSQEKKESASFNKSSMSHEEIKKQMEEHYPYPLFINRAQDYICRKGVSWFTELYKRVPANWNEYVNSGIPMIIPKDYFSGKTYHLVDQLDINDTSGFTFTTDGDRKCEFQFVMQNTKTKKNFVYKIPFRYNTKRTGASSPVSDEIFNQMKIESLYQFYLDYAIIYSNQHNGKAPASLKEMLGGEGQLIEKSWNWKSSGGYFEFGADVAKNRVYLVRKYKPEGKKSVYIEQLYPEEQINQEPVKGKTYWEYSNEDKVPAKVLTKTKFIDTNGLYAFYQSFSQS